MDTSEMWASGEEVLALCGQEILTRDVDGAARDVEAAINVARSYLPTNPPSNPTYRKINSAAAPVMVLDLTSDVNDQGAIYDTASSVIQQKISQIQGVGQVQVVGSSLPATSRA